MRVELSRPIDGDPRGSRARSRSSREDDGRTLVYRYDTRAERTGIARLLAALSAEGITLRDLQTRQSSLEDIFVDLVREGA